MLICFGALLAQASQICAARDPLFSDMPIPRCIARCIPLDGALLEDEATRMLNSHFAQCKMRLSFEALRC